SVSLPSQVFSGERFPIDISLSSPRRPTATVEITAEGKSLGVNRVEMEPGINHFRVHANVSSAGAVDLGGRISGPELGEERFDEAFRLRRPKVLVITLDPAGTEKHLMQLLEANQSQVRRSTNGPPDDLSEFQWLIFHNWEMEQLSPGQKASVEEFV